MHVKPILCSGDYLVELFCLGVALQLSLALALLHPEDGVVGIRVDCFMVKALIPAECEGVDNGKKLTDIVGATDGAEVEYAIARLKVYRLIFHRTGIATACRIHRPRVCPYLEGQGQNRVVPVCRWIYILSLQLLILHSFRHFNTQQIHAVLDDLGNVLGQHEPYELLLLIRLVQDGIVVVELVEDLCQFIAVVGDA